MKLAQLVQRAEQNDPLQLRGLKMRVALAILLVILFGLTAPAAVIPALLIIFVAAIALIALNGAWMAWGKAERMRIPVAALTDVLMVTAIVHYLGGIETSFYWLYTLIIVPYVFLGGKWIGLHATLSSSLCYSSLLVGEFQGRIPHLGFGVSYAPPLLHDSAYLRMRLFSDNTLFFIAFVGGCIIANIAYRKYQELQKVSEVALQMRDTLRQYSAGLEKTVAERTASLTATNEQLRAEIADRKRAEKALRESKERYKTLVEEATDIICTIDLKTGVISSANAYAAKALGYTANEVLHKLSFIDLVHPDDHEKVARRLSDFILKRERTPNYSLRLKKADGTYLPVEVNGATTYDSKGNPETFIGVLRDVTERRRAEEALRESETRYRTLVDNSLTCIALIQDDNFIFANQRMLELSGYSFDELSRMSSSLDIVHPEDREFVFGLARQRLSGQDPESYSQYRVITKDARVLWMETFGTLVEHQGKPAILANSIDITERKRAEEELKNSEERLQILFEYAPDAYYLNDLNGAFVDGNKAAQQLIGYPREQLIGRNMAELNLLPPDQLPKALRNLEENRKGISTHDELVLKRKDGTSITVEIRTFPVTIGKQPLVLGIARDVTKRKHANELLRRSEEKYRASEEKYRTLLDLFDLGFYETDLAGNFIFFNETIRRYLGYPEEELLGLNFRSYVSEEDAKIIYRSFNRVFKTGVADKGFVCNVITKEGQSTPVEFSVSLVRDECGMPVGFRGVTRDITERIRAEEQLRKSEEKYRTLFEESKDVVCILAPDGELLDINPAGLHLFGASSREEALKKNIYTFINTLSSDREKLRKEFSEKGYVKDFELNITDKNGRRLNLLITANSVRDDRGAVVAYRGILRDVTEKKQLEQQLFQAQKMESIGTLAGGIAHDFNNLLGGILGYASFMKSKLNGGHEFFGYVETIERSAMRAAELTSQLLGFARGGKYDTKAISLNGVVIETMKIIGRTFDKSIEIETHLADQTDTVEADASQIQQVLMNLCVNAMDAMPLGGKLIIETELVHLSEDYARVHVGAEAGAYVTLSVTDTGIGMDKETMKRIFDPFFTTKEKGKGTGLGLAMVYGVIKNHSGFVRVYSEPGAGSTFKVFLPAAGKPERTEPAKVELPQGGNEAILIVDDEEAIRSLAKDTLESNGYKVLLAENGIEAVEIYQRHGGQIALVILDMVMPKMGGRETFLRMREINPDIKALLSTGYSQNGKAKEILECGVLGFIQKPYQVNRLLAEVRHVIDLAQ